MVVENRMWLDKGGPYESNDVGIIEGGSLGAARLDGQRGSCDPSIDRELGGGSNGGKERLSNKPHRNRKDQYHAKTDKFCQKWIFPIGKGANVD
ncbi:hypothetical protein NPIL_207601 [Nephila pilipes]|uniref:Uncharacterized protein n=1 Tax=Nephila pilipes TaxID=299642 RepID=A0A8X6PD12_NEPPI|nr:hypothetical protein NPIL_207601 [Nephila pilipes]